MKVSYDVSKFKVGDRVHINIRYGDVPNTIHGSITAILDDGIYEITATGGGKFTGPEHLIYSDGPTSSFNCCGCVHFELCRSMFGGAGKLPCDFDDYFEAREEATECIEGHSQAGANIQKCREFHPSEDLLEELLKIDPDTWSEYARQLVISVNGVHVGLGGTSIQGRAVLQQTIQDKCKRLKWHHDVCYNDETKKYVSLVVPPGNETWLESVEADTAAKAILIAYINAKESLK